MKINHISYFAICLLLIVLGTYTTRYFIKHQTGFYYPANMHSSFPNFGTPEKGSDSVFIYNPLFDGPAGKTGIHEEMLSSAFDYHLGNACLNGEAGSMDRNTPLTIRGLSTTDLPPLNMGMINVTGEHAAYRMLPHGMLFTKDIRVTLPYDSTLLPPGFHPHDIKTYYYDENYQQWIAIKRDSVDETKKVVISSVDHFTDFINAVIKTPDMPESEAFVPTTMDDIQPASPLEGIRLMQPPTANHMGVAHMNYPLELPPGRQGIQPNLTLSYNSSTGNGWTGHGWTIAIPVISVETRWGVPLYDPEKESEGYLLNGEQLATKNENGDYNPLPHRDRFADRQQGDVRFYTRVEGSFLHVTRHGNNPAEYWWEVKTKEGLTYFYGKKLTSDEVDPLSVLRDDNNNIAKWGLTEIRDLNHNFVHYKYDIISRNLGKSLVFKEIVYTGHVNNSGEITDGKFKIKFEKASRSQLGLKDVTFNGRYGFLEMNDDLLTEIDIFYGDERIRGYRFDYSAPNRKTLLKSIRELTAADFSPQETGDPARYDRLSSVIHHFDYHEMQTGFGEPVTIQTGEDPESLHLIDPILKQNFGSLDASIVESQGTGKNNGKKCDRVFHKLNYIGKPVSSGTSTSEGIIAIIDIDGDGLPDKVFKNGEDHKIYYRKQYADGNDYKFSTEAKELQGIETFFQAEDESVSAGIAFQYKRPVRGRTISATSTVSSVNTYFSDVDADGFPDLVCNGAIYFNRPSGDNGRMFVADDSDRLLVDYSCDSIFIFQDGTVDTRMFTSGDTVITERCYPRNVKGETGTNLILNGDFEQGVRNFYCGYTLFSGQGNMPDGYYGITTSAHLLYNNFVETPDHTYKNYKGNYMVVKGPAKLNKVVWEQKISVQPHSYYDLGGWFASLNIPSAGLPIVQFYIEGEPVGEPFRMSQYDPNIRNWIPFEVTWFSGNLNTIRVSIRVVDTGTSASNFAIDDLYMKPRYVDSYYCVYDTVITTQQIPSKPAYDAVRMWTAPFPGVIQIQSKACLTEDLREARQLTPALDGVKVSVQKNETILASRHLKPGTQECFDPLLRSVYVKEGDRIYFRMESQEKNLYDKVTWSPVITYKVYGNSSAISPYPERLDFFNFDASNDFLVSTKKKYYMGLEGSGRVRMENRLSLDEPLQSALMVSVYRNGISIPEMTKIFTRSGGENLVFDTEFNVNENDSIWLEIEGIGGNENWKSIHWDSRLYYIQSSTGMELFDTRSVPGDSIPVVCYDNLVPHYKTYPRPVYPPTRFTTNTDQTLSSITVNAPGVADHTPFILRFRKSNGSGSGTYSGKFINGTRKIFRRDPPTLTAGTYYLELFIDTELSFNNSRPTVSIPSGTYSTAVYGQYPDSELIFGNRYRGWGQFAYLKDSLDGDAIVESRLVVSSDDYLDEIPESLGDTGDAEQLDSASLATLHQEMLRYESFNPLYPYFQPMEADYANERWVDMEGIAYVKGDTLSNTPNSEKGVKSTVYPFVVKSGGIAGKAVKKQSFSVNITTGVGSEDRRNDKLYSVINHSSHDSRILSEYMDMNGDLYPDVISPNSVLYSKPQGGLSEIRRGHRGIQYSLGAEDIVSKNTDLTPHDQIMKYTGHSRNTLTGATTVSGTTKQSGEGSGFMDYRIIDMNGDGLPDILFADGKVDFNMGYKYTEKRMGNMRSEIHLNHTRSDSRSTGEGTTDHMLWGYQNTGEAPNVMFIPTKNTVYTNGETFLTSKVYLAFIDMDHDGLVDMVHLSNNKMYVSYNLGTAFAPAVPLMDRDCISRSRSHSLYNNTSINNMPASATKDVTEHEDHSVSVSQSREQFLDMNGDGYPDFVTSDETGKIIVRYNLGGKENLLKSVRVTINEGPALVQTDIDYTLTKKSTDNPRPVWAMTYVQHRGYEDFSRTIFTYDSAYYNRYERENLGFGIVKSIHLTKANRVYRTITEKYHNREFILKGRKYYELLSSDSAAMNKFVEKTYRFALKDIATGALLSSDLIRCYGKGYPALHEETVHYYEGQASPAITARKIFIHGPFGNITEYINLGDVGDDDDDISAYITYHEDRNNLNLTGIPSGIAVYDASGREINHRKNTVDPNTGKITEIRVKYNEYEDPALYEYIYDEYGNIQQITLPENHQGERMAYTYIYDTDVMTYPKMITDALNNLTMIGYNVRWGKPQLVNDINRKVTAYTYDHRGRLIRIKKTDDPDYTVKFYYSIDDPRWTWEESDNFFKAKTVYYDAFHPDNPVEHISISNGFALHQEKKDAAIEGNEEMVVSGMRVYDEFHRLVQEYYPMTERLGNLNYSYNFGRDQAPPVQTEYDIMDRKTSVTLPDGNRTTLFYGFGRDDFGKTRFKSTVKDAKGNVMETFTDVRGLVTTTRAPMNTSTRFMYDAAGNLIASIDPEDHATKYSYDMLGRCTEKHHPASGTETYIYDPAGNLIARNTQTLLDRGMQIEYQYTYDKLTAILYPEHPENNVFYQYIFDSRDPYNRTGRLAQIETATGYQEFRYGNKGEIKEEIRTFVLPNEEKTYTFTMKYEYDSWNRIRSMIYPDGETVSYDYDQGGKLKKVTGHDFHRPVPYLDSVLYNKFGNKTYMRYGNGSETWYSYDDLNRILKMQSIAPNGETMQKLYYDYDEIGNIRMVQNHAGQLSNGFGGEYMHEYYYDNLSRLISYKNEWPNGEYESAWCDMEYSPAGRIMMKSQGAHINTVNDWGMDYFDNTYLYDNPSQPYSVTSVDNHRTGNRYYFMWDDNGNMTYHSDENDETLLCWDEENRLMAAGTKKSAGFYFYDSEGERTYKMTGATQRVNINGRYYWFTHFDNATLYASPYFVVTPKGYTKHFYSGSTRIASQPGYNTIPGIGQYSGDEEVIKYKQKSLQALMNVKVMDCLFKDEPSFEWNLMHYLHDTYPVTEEKDVYYYHNDHLGSASWVTHSTDGPIQYMHYLPFGETQIDRRFRSWNSRYTFSGKEKDQETGYSYFGARYYNSRLSIWLSVDPLSDKYPSFSPYAYCANNPVILKDPDGRDWFENELTGDIFFNSEYGKDAAGTGGMTGDGWKWLGENDMFGEVNEQFLSDNQEFFVPGESYGKSFGILTENGFRTGYEIYLGNQSKAFMKKMGYKSVPTQVLEYSRSQIQREWTMGGNFSFDLGCTTQITEKIGYIPQNFQLSSSRQIGKSLYSNGKGYTEYIIRLNLSYAISSNWLSKLANTWSAIFGGNHDYKPIGPCSPNYDLINRFRNRRQ